MSFDSLTWGSGDGIILGSALYQNFGLQKKMDR